MLRYVLAAAAALSSARAGENVEPQLDRGNVLVHKQLKAPATKDILVVGKNFSATYYVFNMGKTDALNVKVSDNYPSESFEILEGNPERTWAVLPSGANETFSVVIRPKVTGVMQAARAVVDYQYKTASAEADEEEEIVDVTSYSTAPGRVEIITESLYHKVTATYETELSVALAGAVIALLWPYRIWKAASAENAAAGKRR